MTYEDFKIHPLADKFPLIKGAAFDDLVVSIEQRGLLEPVVMLDGQVIDGRNRLRACIKANVEPKLIEYSHVEIPVEEFIWTVNIDRRHLSDEQKAAASLAWEEFEREQAAMRKAELVGRPSEKLPQDSAAIKKPETGDTRDALAKRAGVSRYKIEQAQKVKRHDEERGTNLLERVEAGELKLCEAKREAGIDDKRRSRAEQIRELADQELTASEIATELGIPLSNVYRAAKKNDIVIPPGKNAPSVAAERLEKISQLAAIGYRAEQIAEVVDVQEGYVRVLARREGIALPDDKIGKVRRVDVNRVIGETVLGAAALTAGLNLVDSRIGEIDRDQLPEWIGSLSESIRELNNLLKKLRREEK